MRIVTLFGFALALFASVQTLGQAAEVQPQQPYRTLMARGLRIIAVTLVPAEVNKTPDSVVIVTLQPDRTVAVCTFGLVQWEHMSPIMEDDTKACDVRSYY